MKFSNDGLLLLKRLEGCVTQNGKHIIYDDQTGKPVDTNMSLPRGATIGYGHLIKQGEDFKNGISDITATELLLTDVAMTERAIQNCIIVPIKQNQYDALVLLAYNIGVGNFKKSTIVKYINNPNFHSKQYPDLEHAWKAWNRSGGVISNGLIYRRQCEWDLFIR